MRGALYAIEEALPKLAGPFCCDLGGLKHTGLTGKASPFLASVAGVLHSYARASRTLIDEARRAGARLATAETIAITISHTHAPL